MMKKLVGVTVVAATLVSSVSFAEYVPFKRGRVNIDVPERWNTQYGDEGLTVTDRSGEIVIQFSAIDSGSVHDSTRAARRVLESEIHDLTFSKPEPVDINGMHGFMFTGDGHRHGVNIDASILVLDTPADDRDLMVITIAEDEKLARHIDQVTHIYKSLTPRM